MKKLKKITKILTIFIIICSVLYIGIYFYAWINPKLPISSPNSYYFYDSDNNLINGTNEWIGLDKLNKNLINATIAIEDKRFFKHQGFDFLRIIKAVYNNITSSTKLEGASTITQQYAKNLYLTFDKTLKRKINEAWLTIRIETHYTKEEILEGYLNTINYGGVFGIENASKYYFGKSAADLTLAEASMLAGIPNRPSEYSPLVNFDAAKKRQLIVLKSMLRDKYITEEELNAAYNEEIIIQENQINTSSVGYFQDAVINELEDIKINPEKLKAGGLKIYTTLDINAQKALEESINVKDIQVAGIIMNPNNGAILGIIGGKDYAESQYNRALHTNRSVGSTIKPFLYYSALENNFTASTTFTSEKTTFVFNETETYSPSNWGDLYSNSKLSLAAAIATSDNIYAIKTHLFLGTDILVNTMKRIGVNANLDPIPSLALGSQAISLIEMTQAYATLANEGYKIKPYFIEKIEDIDGNILYEKKEYKEQVLNKSIVYILNELLNNTSNQKYISYTYPTAYVIKNNLTRKYAIKTGTTDFDHLVFGYNKDVVVSLWSGYDDNSKLNNDDAYNNKVMWSNIIEKYLGDKPDNWYTMPNNVVGVLVDTQTGEIANKNTKNSYIQYYIKGTEPNKDYNLDNSIPTINLEE